MIASVWTAVNRITSSTLNFIRHTVSNMALPFLVLFVTVDDVTGFIPEYLNRDRWFIAYIE